MLMFSFTIKSKILVLVMHPVIKCSENVYKSCCKSSQPDKQGRVKSQGCMIWREDHKAVTELFMYRATKRTEINYFPPPRDPRIDSDYMGHSALSSGKVSNTRTGLEEVARKIMKGWFRHTPVRQD